MKGSGTILSIDETSSQVFVSGDIESLALNGDFFVDLKNSIILIVTNVDDKVVSKQISVDQLSEGMSIDAYISDEVEGCHPADALLVR